MINTTRLALLGLVFLVASSAQAAFSPLGLAIVHKIEFPPSDFTVTGARVSALWGIHRQVYGFDLGVIGNMTEQDWLGVGVSGGFNWTKGNTTIIGLQLAGLANLNGDKVRLYGFQISAGVNSNQGESGGVGIQLAPVNLSPHMTLAGIQAGVYNRAHEVYGFQIGLINVADNLHGLQIGLVNFHRQGLFLISPILNFGF